ncbi:CD109 [Mytilus edulis]|uniref:CD109 n=1 Tax=Mytilus edulis TaxID=6550 RepID=A0A8S3U4W1_MYTED|nr:CD109 [Mytilus edulis]
MLHIVIIVTLLSVRHAKSSYLILAPKQVQPGVNFDISVTVLNASSDVTVKAKLVTTINSSFISQTSGTFNRESTNQLSLHVPDSLEQAGKLIIRGTGGLSFTEETYISYHDPKGNMIKQWRNVSHDSGVYAGSMVMTDNPVLVLPKFEVTVHLPSFILTNTPQVHGIVEAKYSYGKPVSGNVEIEANLRYSYNSWNYQGSKAIIRLHNITIGSDGKARFVIPMATIRPSFGISTGQYLVVTANVTETLTDITFSGSEEVTFSYQTKKILFLSTTKTTFKPGLPYKIDAQLTKIDGTPITTYAQGILQIIVFSKEPIPSTTPQYYYGPTVHTYNLNDIRLNVSTAGIISELIHIPDNATKIQIKISFDNIAEHTEVTKYYSPSNSFIQLNVKSKEIMTGDKAEFSIQSTRPLSSVVVQVSIRFNQSKAKPGDNVTISVAADPKSYMYMLVADESSSYLREGNDITKEQVS